MIDFVIVDERLKSKVTDTYRGVNVGTYHYLVSNVPNEWSVQALASPSSNACEYSRLIPVLPNTSIRNVLG